MYVDILHSITVLEGGEVGEWLALLQDTVGGVNFD